MIAQCELCPSKFQLRNNLFKHYRFKHKIDPFSPDCGLVTAKENNPQCPFCEQYFESECLLTNHGRSFHKLHKYLIKKEDQEDDFYPVIHLVRLPSGQYVEGKPARRVNTRCTFCDEYFKDYISLDIHVKLFHHLNYCGEDTFLSRIRLGSQPKVNYPTPKQPTDQIDSQLAGLAARTL